jgi:hypothetical protein
MKKSTISSGSAAAKKAGRPSTATTKSDQSKKTAKTAEVPKKLAQDEAKKPAEQKFKSMTPLKADKSRKSMSPTKRTSRTKNESTKQTITPAKQAPNVDEKTTRKPTFIANEPEKSPLPAYKGPIKFYKNHVQAILSFLDQKESFRLRQVSKVFDGAVEQAFKSYTRSIEES